MNDAAWQSYRRSLGNPSSMTSTDDERKTEAVEYVNKALAGVPRDARVLVLGCGDGHEVKLANAMGYPDVVGITCDEGEFDAAMHKGVTVWCTDIHDLTYARTAIDLQPFDVVISKETLEHLMSPYIALWEINAALKPGGRFVHYIPEGMRKQRDWYHLNCCPPWWWVDLFRKTGFEVTGLREDIQQNRYEGRKVAEFATHTIDDLYSLEDLMDKLTRKP